MRYTEDDYFAVACALDYWYCFDNFSMDRVFHLYVAQPFLFWKVWDEAGKLSSFPNLVPVAIQIALERSGL